MIVGLVIFFWVRYRQVKSGARQRKILFDSLVESNKLSKDDIALILKISKMNKLGNPSILFVKQSIWDLSLANLGEKDRERASSLMSVLFFA
jgi:hypothetical protein